MKETLKQIGLLGYVVFSLTGYAGCINQKARANLYAIESKVKIAEVYAEQVKSDSKLIELIEKNVEIYHEEHQQTSIKYFHNANRMVKEITSRRERLKHALTEAKKASSYHNNGLEVQL